MGPSHPDPNTLGGRLDSLAATHAGASALLAPGGHALTYAGLREQARAVADALASAGIGRGARVALVLPNGPQMASAFVGVAACATCAPLNPGYQAQEFRFYLEDVNARAVVVQRREGGPVRQVAADLGLAVIEIDADASCAAGQFDVHAPAAGHRDSMDSPAPGDVALVLHTSGTTARPKIVALSHANLLASARHIAGHLALGPADRCLNVMPLFHIHGLVAALLAPLASGGSVVCTPGFDEQRFFDWIAEFAPTWYTAVPTIHQRVLAHGALYRERAPAHRFRFVRSSSSALPPRTFERLEALTGAPVIEAYGMTEASHQMASNPLPPAPRKPGSVGVPAGAEIALMDAHGQLLTPGGTGDTDNTGEIVIRGPGVTAGYEGNPQANAASFVNGWFRTGDLGRLDADGYLFINGRLKEIVNRGGEKVSPREVDEALLEHPAVAEAAAFAVPHASLGEDLAVAVALRAGRQADEAELRGFLFGRLAEYKIPSAIVFVDAIPKGDTGKVQRTTLHDKLGHLIARPFVAPGNDVERSLQAIFGEVLGCAAVGVHDNFFMRGGDSLKGTQVMSRIVAQHAIELALPVLFRHPTVAALAVEVQARGLAARRRSADVQAEIDALSDEEVTRLLAEEEARGAGSGG